MYHGDQKMNDRLIKIEELMEMLGGISRPSIYRYVKSEPGFPLPIKIGRATRFRESDVQAYINTVGLINGEGK
jgi:predicted DNA-binding transcriptional regulator AlpA